MAKRTAKAKSDGQALVRGNDGSSTGGVMWLWVSFSVSCLGVLGALLLPRRPSATGTAADNAADVVGVDREEWSRTLCAKHHGSDARALQLCQLARQRLMVDVGCSVRRINSHNASAFSTLLEHARAGEPLILTGVRPVRGRGGIAEIEELLRLATMRGHDVTVSVNQAGAVPKRHDVTFGMYLAKMDASQKAVVAAGSTDKMPPNDDLQYLFPGPVASSFFGKDFETAFGDGRAIIGGAVRYNHAAGGSAFNINGAFMGLPFHFHTSVLHEVVHGAKHFMFYRHGHAPPFGVWAGATDPQHAEDDSSMHSWILSRDGRAGPSLPDFECTVAPGDTIFVPYSMTHATFNYVPTASLIRSGCNGMVPGLRKESLDPQCPGPPPPKQLGHNSWRGADFIEQPPADRPDPNPTYAHLLRMGLHELEGTRHNRDFRVKFIVMAGHGAESEEALRKAEQLAAKAAREYGSGGTARANPPFVWVHVPCDEPPNAGNCPHPLPQLFADARALERSASEGNAQPLGHGVSASRVEEFLRTNAPAIRELAARLRTVT